MSVKFTPLPPDIDRCNGFTCPHDREQCRRFTERRLATAHTPWTHGIRSGDVCTEIIPVMPAARGLVGPDEC